jgi:hypothetical protein
VVTDCRGSRSGPGWRAAACSVYRPR